MSRIQRLGPGGKLSAALLRNPALPWIAYVVARIALLVSYGE